MINEGEMFAGRVPAHQHRLPRKTLAEGLERIRKVLG